MRKLCLVFVCLAACSGRERPLTAKCKPAVSVVAVPKSKATAPAAAVKHEVVQVYWDVSKSMRDFKELEPVVQALDGGVLLSAHAQEIEQYGVGESITKLRNATAALHPTANRTVLHLAADRIGGALAKGDAQATIVVSDMELDAPPRGAEASVCNGVPLPSSSEVGTLFGRCFEKTFQASPPANLLAHAFRKNGGRRDLFILLLATDRAFGRRISDEIARRLAFTRHVIFDSGSIAAANVRDCRMTVPGAGMLRTANGCGARCFEAEDVIRVECDARPGAGNAWVVPEGRGFDDVSQQQGMVRFDIPCTTPKGRFQATVSYSWRDRLPADFSPKPSVRDLFASLADAIARTVPPRRLRIGVDLAR